MLTNLPTFIPAIFITTTLLTFLLFYWILKNSKNPVFNTKKIMIGLGLWLIAQALISLSNFYNTQLEAVPPRFLILVVPPLLLILYLFNTPKGKNFIDALPLLQITHLNIVRVPVELVLLWLFLNKAIPEVMTFEGRNFDIIAGITAPLVAYFGIQQGKLSRSGLLIWNIAMLGLLLNIIIHAILAAPLPFQQIAFDQPNMGVLYFPFTWLPSFIVPIVLFGHLVSIRQLTKKAS